MRRKLPIKDKTRQPKGQLPVRGAKLHNLKNVDVDIPVGIMTVITGVVAG